MRNFYQDATYADLKTGNITSWESKLIGQIIAAAATIIIGKAGAAVGAGLAVNYGWGSAAAGKAAGLGVSSAATTYVSTKGNWQYAIAAGVLAAVMSGIDSYFGDNSKAVVNDYEYDAYFNSGEYPAAMYSDVGQGSTPAWWANVMHSGKKFLSKAIVKNTIKIALGQFGADGVDRGYATYNYDSTDDQGIFAQLAGLMDTIAPKSTQMNLSLAGGGGYPARNGLNYVPRDNFPIIAHKGERVQTRQEADRTRSGRGGVSYTFNLYTTVADKKAVNEFADQIYPRLQKLQGWGH